MDYNTKRRVEQLAKVAKTWPSKASIGLKRENSQFAKYFADICNHIDAGKTYLLDKNYPNIKAISEFKAVLKLLNYTNNKQKYGKEKVYHTRIYEKCDSGMYRQANVKNVKHAVEELISIAEKTDKESIDQYY